MSQNPKARVVLAGKIARVPVESALTAHPGVDLVAVETVREAIDAMEGADVLVVPDPRGEDGPDLAARLREGSGVRWVQILSAGHAGLTAHPLPDDLVVTNQGGAISPTVSEHAVALLLACTRQVPVMVENQAAESWWRDFDPPLLSLEGRTVVIVGFGHVGREVAQRLRAFGARIVGVNRSGDPHELADRMVPLERLHDALAEAAAVVVTITLSARTRGLMGAAEFEACPPGAVFVNVSRGETVDQAALRQALESGHLRSAAVDVTTPEPLPVGDPLWGAPRLIISPHTAGAGSTSAGARIAGVVSENIDRFLNGMPLLNRVETNEA